MLGCALPARAQWGPLGAPRNWAPERPPHLPLAPACLLLLPGWFLGANLAALGAL